ncbi:protein SERAC1 isoform X2 [Culicoides brevitarsis]|uniref:protein SERAC1 isoform X2 n=1 Tax=Culicoides brevitarsis TaxID=469753 RepID=UPI00307BF92E
MTKQSIYANYKRLGTGIGLTSALGLISYEFYKIHKQINSVVNTRVLDLHRKGPEFIYIKHHIYRKSLEKELKAQQSKNFVNVIVHPFGKWWKKFKHSLAWRLLRMAQEGSHDERIKAIQQLALIDHLKDWDFQHLAQLCDYRTAIALARAECDLRWFLRPPCYGVKQTPLETALSLKALLEQMGPNRCIEYALENNLQIHQMRDPEGDTVVDGMRLTKHENEIMTQALDALLHLTTFKDFCEKFIEARGLEILMEMEKLDQTDINYRLTLCRIVANLTEFNDFSYDFFVTGWIGILAKWSRDEDMRIQVTASLALANLDKEDNFPIVYPSKVYPLYPRNERKLKPNVDVIFVHGLLGGVFITWRQKKTMTPEVSSISNTKSNAVLPRKIKKSLHFPDFFKKKEEPVVETVISDRGETLIPMKHVTEDTVPNIADTQTQEIIKALKEDEGIGNDWEVVFHDVPVGASENDSDSYAVSGDEWLNEESRDDYTYCWPMEWIPEDFPNARILGLNYESSLTQWYGTNCPCLKNASQLKPRATEFLDKITKAGVGQRPIVWIGHSMGGLIIKSIIVQASQHPDPAVQNICNNTKGIIFLGTPHKGSPVAKLKQSTSAILWVSAEVQDMKEGNSTLLKLNEDFLKIIKNGKENVEIASLGEGRPTIMTSWKFPLLIVAKDSARFEHGEFYLTSDDHLGLSKPMCRQSFLYQRLEKLIRNATKPEQSEIDEENARKQDKQEYEKFAKQQMYHMLFNFG